MLPIAYVDHVFRCIVVRRVNKFVAEVIFGDRKIEYAYINNTGRLDKLLSEGKIGFCQVKKRGKLRFRLFAIYDDGYGAILDTMMQMRAFEKALELGAIPWLANCRVAKRNVRLGNSLIDYLLMCNLREVYLEVKSAVLREGEYALYPDCLSLRGRRHIRELIKSIELCDRCIILFIAALPNVSKFKPNNKVDSIIHSLLRKASKIGVEIKAIGMLFNPSDNFIYLYDPNLKVEL